MSLKYEDVEEGVCVCVQAGLIFGGSQGSPQINDVVCFSTDEGFCSYMKSTCFLGQHLMINEITSIILFLPLSSSSSGAPAVFVLHTQVFSELS